MKSVTTFTRSLMVLAISLPLSAAALAEGEDVEAAAACAQLVMFENAYCEFCELWHEEIGPAYPNTPEGRAAPLRTEELWVDRSEDLKDIKGIVYTPTFVLVQDGKEIGRLVGYIGREFFWALLAEMYEKAGLGSDGQYCIS